jgi:nitrite reductase (NO-forming)
MTDPAPRRCRARRPIDPAGPRPSDLLAAFFAAALAMLAAAALATVADAITGDWRLHWLALHLALLGGVSQLVLGAGQFFVCAFLATSPPSRRLAGAQLGVWNAGTVLVAVGVPTGTPALTEAGAVLVAAGLVLFAGSMRAMQRRSLQRARWAVRWYQASATSLVAGVVIGALLARGVAWSHGSLLGAHLALNVAGWMGAAVVGTLHTFFPSLTGTQLRFPRLQGPALYLWMSGVVALAVGAALSTDPLVAAGWVALAAAAVLLLANVVASLAAREIALSLPARLVTLAQAFLPAGLILALVATIAEGAPGPLDAGTRPALAIVLLGGWVALTVAGSLLHLLAVLARVRHLTAAMPAARPARDRAVATLAGVAVVVWALAQVDGLDGLGTPALVLRLAAAAVVGGHIAASVLRAARAAVAGRGGARSPRARLQAQAARR